MANLPVICPGCKCGNVIKHGKTGEEKQRYRCTNTKCPRNTFILDYSYKGCLEETKKTAVDMAINGSGIRDTSRVLQIAQNTVIGSILEKKPQLETVNHAKLEKIDFDASRPVSIVLAADAEIDEMWSFVQNKSDRHWLWHAIDHYTGTVLAYVFGDRKDVVFKELKALLKPFGIKHFYTDDWGAYERNLDPESHTISKKFTQKIERKHLTLRTRIKRLTRKTICFSKTKEMHETVIGIFINRHEFGRMV